MAGCGRWVLLVVSLAAGLHRPALAEKRYQYGGVDKTGEHLGVMPKETGVDFSGPNQGFCDGCLSTVETFHLQWLKYVTKESAEGDEVDQKSGGSAPPAITYNDEVEDMVVSRLPPLPPPLRAAPAAPARPPFYADAAQRSSPACLHRSRHARPTHRVG